MDTVKEVLCQALEQLGDEWVVFPVSHVRNEIGRIGVLISANKLVANKGITVEEIRVGSPTFCSLYRKVMLRDIEETICSGDDE